MGVILVGLLLAGITLTHYYVFRPWTRLHHDHVANEARYDQVVSAYVHRRHGWSDRQFIIYYSGQDGRLLRFYVQYNFLLPQPRYRLGSDGKSFVVVVDSDRMVVVNEFQPE